MDPGAAVMDRADADALRDEVLEELVARAPDRRGTAGRPAGRAVPARCRKNRTRWCATRCAGWRITAAPPCGRSEPADLMKPLRQAAATLRTFVDSAACTEEETTAIADELDACSMATAPAGDGAEIEVLLHACHHAGSGKLRHWQGRVGVPTARRASGRLRLRPSGSKTKAARAERRSDLLLRRLQGRARSRPVLFRRSHPAPGRRRAPSRLGPVRRNASAAPP